MPETTQNPILFTPLQGNRFETRWANRLMRENGYDRKKAIASIPTRLDEKQQGDIRETLTVMCFGPQGGPLCVCDPEPRYGEDE